MQRHLQCRPHERKKQRQWLHVLMVKIVYTFCLSSLEYYQRLCCIDSHRASHNCQLKFEWKCVVFGARVQQVRLLCSKPWCSPRQKLQIMFAPREVIVMSFTGRAKEPSFFPSAPPSTQLLRHASIYFPKDERERMQIWLPSLSHTGLGLSLPVVINFKFPLQPHQKYYITQYEELGFS